jgi:hypothetical protein
MKRLHGGFVSGFVFPGYSFEKHLHIDPSRKMPLFLRYRRSLIVHVRLGKRGAVKAAQKLHSFMGIIDFLHQHITEVSLWCDARGSK